MRVGRAPRVKDRYLLPLITLLRDCRQHLAFIKLLNMEIVQESFILAGSIREGRDEAKRHQGSREHCKMEIRSR